MKWVDSIPEAKRGPQALGKHERMFVSLIANPGKVGVLYEGKHFHGYATMLRKKAPAGIKIVSRSARKGFGHVYGVYETPAAKPTPIRKRKAA